VQVATAAAAAPDAADTDADAADAADADADARSFPEPDVGVRQRSVQGGHHREARQLQQQSELHRGVWTPPPAFAAAADAADAAFWQRDIQVRQHDRAGFQHVHGSFFSRASRAVQIAGCLLQFIDLRGGPWL
jgi:hypothetical protein